MEGEELKRLNRNGPFMRIPETSSSTIGISAIRCEANVVPTAQLLGIYRYITVPTSEGPDFPLKKIVGICWKIYYQILRWSVIREDRESDSAVSNIYILDFRS